MLVSSKADLLVYGMGEAPIVEIARRLAAGETVAALRDLRGVAYLLGRKETLPAHRFDDAAVRRPARSSCPRSRTCRATRSRSRARRALHHHETNPLNGAAPDPAPRRPRCSCRTRRRCRSPRREMDAAYDLPYARRPHPRYAEPIPAFDMIRDSRDDHARLLRRLHVLQHHDAPGPHHPEPQRALDPARGRPRSRRSPDFKGTVSDIGGPDRQHVPDALHAPRGRGEVPAALVHPPDDLQAARHRPRPDDRRCCARRARVQGVEARARRRRASAWTSRARDHEYVERARRATTSAGT